MLARVSLGQAVVHDADGGAVRLGGEGDLDGAGAGREPCRAGVAPTEHQVTAHSAFEPRNILVRALSPVIKRKFHHTQRAILAGLKASVEANA